MNSDDESSVDDWARISEAVGGPDVEDDWIGDSTPPDVRAAVADQPCPNSSSEEDNWAECEEGEPAEVAGNVIAIMDVDDRGGVAVGSNGGTTRPRRSLLTEHQLRVLATGGKWDEELFSKVPKLIGTLLGGKEVNSKLSLASGQTIALSCDIAPSRFQTLLWAGAYAAYKTHRIALIEYFQRMCTEVRSSRSRGNHMQALFIQRYRRYDGTRV